MKHFILFFLLLLTLSGTAQIPNPFHKNAGKIALKFKKKYPDDSTRVVAIYDWLNSYMRYDYRAFRKYKFQVNNYSLNRLLYRRKALCYGLSKLFKEICLRSGVKCILLEGYSFENPEDAYIHYYYDDHAWNAVEVNKKWYLFDVTYDNGYIVFRKRVIRKFLNQTLGIPFVYSKTKFVRHTTHRFFMQSGAAFVSGHYPVLINGLLLNEKIRLDSFATGMYDVEESYNASFYPTMAQLSTYASTDEPIRLKTEADQSMLFNPKNNLVKALNYYNSLLDKKDIRIDFNKSDVDTVIKYAVLFKKDNTMIHGMNNKRVKDEHKRLLAPLGRTIRHNGRLISLYDKRAYKAFIKFEKTADANSINSDKIIARFRKLEKTRAGKSRKLDTIPFIVHLENHKQVLRTTDSLSVVLNGEEKVLDSLSIRSLAFFDTMYYCMQQRVVLARVHCVKDIFLSAYPRMSGVGKSMDSLTALIDRYKVLMEKSESEYNKCRGQAMRAATTGFNTSCKDYVKIKTAVSVPSPYFKDSLIMEDWSRAQLFKNILVSLHHHNEEILHRQTLQFPLARSCAKAEKKQLKKVAKYRNMAYETRMTHEKARFLAYDRLIIRIASRMQVLKMTYKRKKVYKKK